MSPNKLLPTRKRLFLVPLTRLRILCGMKIIAHIDLDAFFASVEEREKPWFEGMPVVVGADPLGGKGRGVVSTANYKAREYGVGSALPISKAWKLCEEAKKKGGPSCAFIVPRFAKYSEASTEVFDVVAEYTEVVQQTSVDEAYLDFTKYGSYRKAEEFAERLRNKIKRKTRLTASIGIGPNKMIAKIASDFHKPNGLTVILPKNVESFLAPLPVRKIPGIGPKTATALKSKNIHTVQDIRTMSWEVLEKQFGKWGFELYEKAWGRGSDTLHVEEDAKSVGEHETFMADTKDMRFVSGRLSKICTNIICHLEKKKDKNKDRGIRRFRTVVLTVRFSDFETRQRSITSKEPMCTLRELNRQSLKLLLPFFERKENPRKKAIRMIGVRVEKFG
jgi:nucleotidyltransferase/DNA polymerase involved in DNA repair